MKKTVRNISLLLIFALLFGLFAGCSLYKDEEEPAKEGTQKAEATSDSAKPAENVPELAKTWPEFAKHHQARIVCFEMGWTGPESDKDFITPEIEKRTNFKLIYEPMTVSTQEDLNQKLNLMVASKEVPDLFFGSSDPYSRSIYDKLGETGLLWDVAPLIKNYKNIYTLLKPELILYRTKDKKANYYIPTQTGRGNDLIHCAPAGLYVREDFIKKLNMPYPTTPEELYTYLKRVKEEIKTVYGKPIIGYTCDENFTHFEWSLIQPFWPINPGANGFTFDPHDNFKVINYVYTDSPELMRAAKFVNKLYREGLIDREIITHKRAQYQEKVSSGRVAAMGSSWWDANTFADNAKSVVPDAMFVTPPPVFDKTNGVPKYPDDKWTNWIGCFSTLTVSKKLDEGTVKHFLALLDYFATKDGQILVQVGIEGKNFTYDENGKYKFTDEFKKQTADLDWNKAASYGVFYWQQLVFNLPAFDSIRAEYPELVREDNKKGWENKKWHRDRYDPDMKPTKDYYFIAGLVELQKMPAINQAKQEMWAKVLVAKSEADVEKIIHDWAKTCKDMGIDEIIAERQNYMDTLDISEQE